MRVKLVKIGNSLGVRIPTAIIKSCGFVEEADLDVHQKMVILRPVFNPREGWAEAIEKDLKNQPMLTEGEWQW